MGAIQRFGLPVRDGVPASQAVEADGWLFVAGQVPKNKQGEFVVGGIAEQARQALDNLMMRLEQAGYAPERLAGRSPRLRHLQPHLQSVFFRRARSGARDCSGAHDE